MLEWAFIETQELLFFPMKCFTVPLKLLGFPPLGVLIPERPNRRNVTSHGLHRPTWRIISHDLEAQGKILHCRWP